MKYLSEAAGETEAHRSAGPQVTEWRAENEVLAEREGRRVGEREVTSD